MTNEEKVLIRGKVFLYKAKAPFVPSGVSIHGALEYDEAKEKVRCHECGEWRRVLSRHVSIKHGISPRQYRLKHGLRTKAPLHGPGATATYRQNRPSAAFLKSIKGGRERAMAAIERKRANASDCRTHAEQRNENNTCKAQILARLETLAQRLGATPTAREMRESGLHARSIVLQFNARSMADVFSLIGLKGNTRGAGAQKNCKYTKPLLVELMRDFYVKHRRRPGRGDERAGLIPSLTNYRRHFGSMASAYEAAGLGNIG